MEVLPFLFTILLGIGVLIAYYVVLGKWVPSSSYRCHPFWLGISENNVNMLSFFQLLAVGGFLTASMSWLVTPPKGGVMDGPLAFPLTICVFLISAIGWPLATYYKYKWLTVTSLISTAVASVVLLAGSIEEEEPRWYVILGWLLLSLVTVLGDGVVWNAKYIQTLQNNPSYFDRW
jgi:hypothetical protein